MPAETLLILAVSAAIAATAIIWVRQEGRHEQLREDFGPEHDDAADRNGSELWASQASRVHGKERTRQYQLRSLSSQERARFEREWSAAQTGFVDDPPRGLHVADSLACRLMKARGYPVSDFERRAEDISVSHRHIVKNFRISHEIARAAATGRATTEDVRRAMAACRELFSELLESHNPEEVRQ